MLKESILQTSKMVQPYREKLPNVQEKKRRLLSTLFQIDYPVDA